jgi:hypothetical protein
MKISATQVILAGTLALLPSFGGDQDAKQTLTIRLYDYSDLSAKETARLTETVDLVFAHSGIHVIWLQCRGEQANCEAEMQVNQIVVRLQPGAPRATKDERMLEMGHAIVTEEGGRYANVYVPAVRAQAMQFGMAFDLLLGYAVAHEAGHCLLGPGHSFAGLMRAAWNRKDAGEMSRLSLHLTKQEAQKAAARLSLAERAAN